VLNTRVFLQVVEKCLRADNRERAIKLTRASDAAVAKLANAALTLEAPRFQAGGDSGYRGAAARAPVSLPLAAVAKAQQRRLLPSVVLGLLAPIAPAVSLLLVSGPLSDTKKALLALAVVGVASGLGSLYRYSRVRRDLAETIACLTPWMASR
jgi:hypothetical protein